MRQRGACALAAAAARNIMSAAPKPAAAAAAAPLSTSARDDGNDTSAGAAWLRGLVDHERQGVPDGAGDPNSSRKFDLAPTRALLEAMGRPQASLRRAVAHVAGTKGKGSVAAMLSSALRASGFRVGTYSSPHLLSASERAVVGGGAGGATIPMPPEEAERLAGVAAKSAAAISPPPSHFEASTAVALRWFADERVDAAVVECGVGGETDATNVFSEDALAVGVLTPVGQDHLAALGGSVAAAARAKAGILKSGRPAVVAAQPVAEARAALREAVAQSGARPVLFLGGGGGAGEDGASSALPPLDVRVEAAGPVELLPPEVLPTSPQRPKFKHLASQAVRVKVVSSPAGGGGGDADRPDSSSLALLRELEDFTRASPIRMRLVGAHQRANAAAAIAAAALMAGEEKAKGSSEGRPTITAPAIARGLSDAFLPGRFQVLGLPPAGPEAASASAGERRRYLILDCAHTPESAEALARTARAALDGAATAATAGAGAASSSSSTSDADAPPVVLVLAMADDKPHRDVAAQLLYRLRPRAVIFTSVPIAGGRARAASATQLAAQWQAAAMLPMPRSSGIGVEEESKTSSRPPRCREYIQASLKAALQKARRELETALAIGGDGGGGGGGSGVGAVVVAGSNHAVAAALRDLGVEDIVEQLE
jgi:folylpolyglutamate synthase/dihydropteroate synthase